MVTLKLKHVKNLKIEARNGVWETQGHTKVTYFTPILIVKFIEK